MTLTIPPYIEKVRATQPSLAFKWDDRNAEQFYLKPNEKLRHSIHMISDRGILALSLGFAEWIAWRSEHEVVTTTVLPALETMWAAVIDWRYLSPTSRPSWSGWSGPVLGPLAATFRLLADVIRLTKTEQFASPEAVSLSQLAENSLSDPKPFREWRRDTILRLSRMHPDREGDSLGDPVPRVALDPEFDYTPEKAPALLEQFLSKLDCRQNPFLASPAQLKKAGFKGVPYTYKAAKGHS